MPVRSSAVGLSSPPYRATCDARWLMSYAAGLGLSEPVFLDTTRPGGVVGHPVFPVAPEWGLLTSPETALDYGVAAGEAIRGVHVGHDLTLHRPVRQDDDVVVTATVAGAETTRAGARLTLLFEAVDASGELVWSTWHVSLYLGVAVEGPDRPPVDAPDRVASDPSATKIDQRSIAIAPWAAHVYTECARIWNPIHTDATVARAAGLPGPILHGTATLAHGVSAALEMTSGEPEAVRRLGGSFRAMVPMPSTISVELLGVTEVEGGRLTHFQVRASDDDLAVRDGFVMVAA